MRSHVTIVATLAINFAAFLHGPVVSGQTTVDASRLIGVWQPVEVTSLPLRASLLDGGMPRLGPAGPGLVIITPRHYALLELNNGGLPRPSEPDSTATAAELIAMWGPLAANAGTYEIKGDTFLARPTVSKNPRAMRLPPARRVIRLLADTLWFDRPGNGTIKYVRLER